MKFGQVFARRVYIFSARTLCILRVLFRRISSIPVGPAQMFSILS